MGRLRAATLFGIAATVWARIGTTPEFAVSVPHRKHLGQTRQALGDTRFGQAFAAGRALPDDEALRYALGEPTPLRSPSATPSPAALDPLTVREAEIARLVAEGLTNRDIAAKLVISRRTADTHVQHVLTKLGFNNRAQIAAWVVSRRA